MAGNAKDENTSSPIKVDGMIYLICQLQWCADAEKLFAFDQNGMVYAYTGPQLGDRVLELAVDSRSIEFGAASPDGSKIVVGGEKRAELWDVDRETQIASFESPYFLQAAAFIDGGRRIMLGAEDAHVTVYDLPSFAPVDRALTGERHSSILPINGSDVVAVAAASQAGSVIRFLDTKNSLALACKDVDVPHDELTAVSFNSDGSRFAFADNDIHVYAYPENLREQSYTAQGIHTDELDSQLLVTHRWSNPAFVSNTRFAICRADSTDIILLEVGKPSPIARLSKHEFGVSRLAHVPGRGLVSAGRDAKLYLWPELA